MKTIAVLFASLGLVATLHAAPEPNIITKISGIAEDKQLHFGVGYIAPDILGAISGWLGLTPEQQRIVRLGSGFVLATGKETYDALHPHGVYDWGDWGATMLGCGMSMAVHWGGSKPFGYHEPEN